MHTSGTRWFLKIFDWLDRERSYQQEKFDYELEKAHPPEYWVQQFDSYIQRIPIFGLDTIQGAQAALKLAATAIACAEHICERIDSIPKPGVPSGEIEKW